jgi:hypothetical protein
MRRLESQSGDRPRNLALDPLGKGKEVRLVLISNVVRSSNSTYVENRTVFRWHAACSDEAEMDHPIREMMAGVLCSDMPAVSRELGNTLLTMAAATARLQRSAEASPLGEGIRMLDKDLARAIRLARTLSERIGARQGCAEYTSLRDLLQALASELRVRLPDAYSIASAFGDRPAIVAVRLAVIAPLLVETCASAVDAMPDGGELGLALREVKGSVVTIRVTDDGNGSNAKGPTAARLLDLARPTGARLLIHKATQGAIVEIELDGAC